MKRAVSLLLALVMVLALAACGPQNNPGTSNPGTNNPGTNNPGTNDPGTPTTRPNRFIYGTTTALSGDMTTSFFGNNATDKLIRDLMFEYSTVAMNRNAEYVVNPTVCDGDIQIVVNADGSKTYTNKIKQGLTFNNGEPITAKDFAAYFLVMCSPALSEAGGSVDPTQFIGGGAYAAGEADCITGVRLLDEYTLSFTLDPEYSDYYYELLNGSIAPLHLASYNPNLSVKDDGQGIYLEGGEVTIDDIQKVRDNYNRPVTDGPYILTDVDMGSYTATLEINPYYAGNYEGQKPSIQTLVITYTASGTEFDSLTTGGVDMLDSLSEGDKINKALDMVEEGGYDYVSYDRVGYGYLGFCCDGGPSQFVEVRQAVAYLLDRNEFANTFTGGHGTVVNGPYGTAQWQYKESKELFASKLNSYDYNPTKAAELLAQGGWNLNADGTPYSGSGLRYKQVTAEEAGTYEYNVTLADGRILMPLILTWCSSEGSPVSDLLATMLGNGPQVTAAGMEIKQEVVAWTELLNYRYRQTNVDPKYGQFKYCMFNMASGFYAYYDQSYSYIQDPVIMSLGYYNTNWIRDDKLSELAWNMVYGTDPSDRAGYLQKFQDFIIRWNELLPDVPLYSNTYHTIFPDWLKGFDEDGFWSFQYGILYASIENAE